MFDQVLEFAQNHMVLSGAFVAIAIAVLAYEMMSGAKGLTPAQAVAMMNRDEAVLVDIRDRKEFAQGHAAGAIHIPQSKLDSQLQTLEKHKDKTIVVACKLGNSATLTVAKLHKAGFTQAVKLKGGMTQWQQDGLVMVKK